MVRHPAIGEDFPDRSSHLLLQAASDSVIVAGIVEQFLAAITASDDVVNGIREFDPWKSRHDRRSGVTRTKL